MTLDPMLEVRMTMAFLNDTVRPWLSVRRPSSRIWGGGGGGGGVEGGGYEWWGGKGGEQNLCPP